MSNIVQFSLTLPGKKKNSSGARKIFSVKKGQSIKMIFRG